MSHDTEASAYNPKTHKILLFTKGAKSQVFELDLNDLQKEMKQIAELNIYKVTGSAYHNGYFYIMNLNSIYKIDEKDIYKDPTIEVFEKVKTRQSEGIAINSKNFVITSERTASYLRAKIIWDPML